MDRKEMIANLEAVVKYLYDQGETWFGNLADDVLEALKTDEEKENETLEDHKSMSNLIDKKVLYNHFVDLEAIALEQVKKHMHDEDSTEWRIWSTILAERTAYKYDVFDAPTVETKFVRHGHWEVDDDGNVKCSECGYSGVGDNYCERCGAKMDGKGRVINNAR